MPGWRKGNGFIAWIGEDSEVYFFYETQPVLLFKDSTDTLAFGDTGHPVIPELYQVTRWHLSTSTVPLLAVGFSLPLVYFIYFLFPKFC